MRRDMKSILVQSPQEGELYGFKVHNFSLYVGESINEMKVLAATSSIYLLVLYVCLLVNIHI